MQRKRKRFCPICGADLSLFGWDHKGACPNCTFVRKGTKIPCAGKCKGVYELRFLQIVNLYFEPSHKGAEKIKVYYCSACLASARSKARLISEAQQKEVVKTESRLRRKIRGDKKGENNHVEKNNGDIGTVVDY